MTLKAITLIDPDLDIVPQPLLNWGNKQFSSFMITQLLKFGKKLKGTKYEKKLKHTKCPEFYDFSNRIVTEYY